MHKKSSKIFHLLTWNFNSVEFLIFKITVLPYIMKVKGVTKKFERERKAAQYMMLYIYNPWIYMLVILHNVNGMYGCMNGIVVSVFVCAHV